MTWRLLSAVLASGLLISQTPPTRTPILVELFTSEGCSSCPPADRLLEALDPNVIVLSEHVDYWDHQGWRDPFSAHNNTLRQESYARHMGTQGPYTPQMVVNGSVELLGSDTRRAADEITKAARLPRTPVQLSRDAASLRITTGPALESADVFLALAQDHQASKVTAGENKGRDLRHVSILSSLRKVGSVKKGAAFEKSVPLPDDSAAKRVIVFLQASDQGRISGAGLLIP